MITPFGVSSATISAVKIRAVTLGLELPAPDVSDAPFVSAGRFLGAARSAFGAAGLEVQTTRLAGADLAARLPQIGTSVGAWASTTEAAARGNGVEYLSLGRLPASAHAIVAD